MKKATFLFLCLCYVCSGQNAQVDSLLKVLKTAKEDTNKIKTLNVLSQNIERTIAYEKAKAYANDALQLAEKLNYKKGKAAAYNNIGTIFCDHGNYPEALKIYSIALKTSDEIGDKLGIGNAYIGIGNVYYFQGNLPESLKDYLAALKAMQEVGDKHGIALSYVKLRNVGSGVDPMKYLTSALQIFKEIDDKRGMAYAYGQLGVRYGINGNKSEELKNYSASLKISQEIGDKRYEAWNDGNLSDIYLEQKDYAQALKLNFDAIKIQEQMDDKSGMVNSYNNLGNIYTKSGKYSEANKYLSAALALSIEIGGNLKRKGIYRDIILLDSARGDYKQALADSRIYYEYSFVLQNENIEMQRTEMSAKYESERNAKEIALLTKGNEIQNIEIKKQRQMQYFFIGGLVLIILLGLFAYRFYRSRQILRLQYIRNKIAGDLHDDIGSTLNSISIYSEVAKNNAGQQDEALEMIGDSSRKIIDAMSDIVWTINPENDSFAKIVFRMKSLTYNLLRAKHIEYTFHVDEELEERKLSLEDRRNFYLTFKEAINNLVKYSAATRVAITLSADGGNMKLRIKDNGVGFNTTRENAGNGLKNMKRRAEEMKAKLNIKSNDGTGTQIELILTA